MKKIIRKFYKAFDKFLSHSVSGNLRLKARITAILTGILISGLVILIVFTALIEFDITIPATGIINRILDERTVEFEILVSARYQESVESGQKAGIWILADGKTPLSAKITKLGKITENGDLKAYLENIHSLSITLDKTLIGKKIKSRITIDKKKLYKILIR